MKFDLSQESTRFRSPYLRHGLWEHGFAVDTLETSADLPLLRSTLRMIVQRLQLNGEPGLAG